MSSSASLAERATTRPVVEWVGSTTSNPVSLQGRTAGLRIYLPAGFSGNQLKVEELVAEDTWAPMAVDGADHVVGVAANKVNVIHGNGEFFGIGTFRFVSNQTETITGRLVGVA